jgi:hypothetical protein
MDHILLSFQITLHGNKHGHGTFALSLLVSWR